MTKSVVLFSAGLDSTVNLYEAKRISQVCLVLTFNYGQKAARREIEKSKEVCFNLKLNHRVIELPWIGELTWTALVSNQMEIPTGVPLDDLKITEESAAAVWVPNRNGVFLNVAATFAESMGAKWVIPGFNREEATTFPDNSQEFVEAVNRSLSFSTRSQVEVRCFTSALDKRAIYRRARELGADFSLMWPCYSGEEKPCGQCESCLRFQRART